MSSATCAPAPVLHGPLVGPEAEAELAQLAKALGHPARVRIVGFLAAQQSCMAGDIAEHLPLAPSTVSQHLSQLKAAGLVHGEIDGPRRCYCLNPAAFARLQALIGVLVPEPPA